MSEVTITQAKRWMSALPRDQFDLLLLLLRWREGAVITELRAEVERFAQAVIELSDNVEDRDGLSDTTEYTVDSARAYRASEKG